MAGLREDRRHGALRLWRRNVAPSQSGRVRDGTAQVWNTDRRSRDAPPASILPRVQSSQPTRALWPTRDRSRATIWTTPRNDLSANADPPTESPGPRTLNQLEARSWKPAADTRPIPQPHACDTAHCSVPL